MIGKVHLALAATLRRLGDSSGIDKRRQRADAGRPSSLKLQLLRFGTSTYDRTAKMAIISASAMIRSLSLFHVTLAALLLRNPQIIANQSVVALLGQSMQLVRHRISCPLTQTNLLHSPHPANFRPHPHPSPSSPSSSPSSDSPTSPPCP